MNILDLPPELLDEISKYLPYGYYLVYDEFSGDVSVEDDESALNFEEVRAFKSNVRPFRGGGT